MIYRYFLFRKYERIIGKETAGVREISAHK